MKIEYFHASRFGNGEQIAIEFKRIMSERDITVNIHHMRDIRPKDIPPADLYVFSSPGCMGKPPMHVRRFLHGVNLPAGTRFALLNTQGAVSPGKDGQMPPAEETAKLQRMTPIMTDILAEKGLSLIATETIDVFNIKGPLEEGWEQKVEAFADRLNWLLFYKSQR